MTDKTKGMGFEGALIALKIRNARGSYDTRVARAGWNGKGMWLQIMLVEVFEAYEEGLYLICMKTAQGYHVPWLASVTDLMAEDWEVVL